MHWHLISVWEGVHLDNIECPQQRCIWKRGRGGGGVWGVARTPLLLYYPMVPTKGGEFFLKLQSSCAEGTEENLEPVSLKQWKRRREGGGGPGGGTPVL